MPEQQASPSSQPTLTTETDIQSRQEFLPPSESAKRTYLSLLPPPQLIDLILAIESNRQAHIFPHDLDSAIKALQRPQRQPSPTQAPAAASVIVKAEPCDVEEESAVETGVSVSNALSSSISQPSRAPPTQVSVVQPPQYRPPQFRPPSHGPPVYPYTHTPYYPPPQHPQPQAHVSPPAAPPPPARHPLFTSVPLTRDPNKPLGARPTPPPVVSSRDDPNAMPSYEEMIVEAIIDVGERDGTAPKILFSWMASHYPLQQNFRPSASQALHKALKRGRLEKLGGKYRLNPCWGGGPTTSKRATRRPTANRALSPPASHPHLPPGPSMAAPPSLYAHGHPPYMYTPYAHQPSLPPHPYNPSYHTNDAGWDMNSGPPQKVLQAMNGVGMSGKIAEMEEDGLESDDIGSPDQVRSGELDVIDEKEKMRQSLVRLARVLKRMAGREGAVKM